jgi:hypothetical protein
MASINIALWAPVAVLWASHLAARAAMAERSGSALTLPLPAQRVPPSPAMQERG